MTQSLTSSARSGNLAPNLLLIVLYSLQGGNEGQLLSIIRELPLLFLRNKSMREGSNRRDDLLRNYLKSPVRLDHFVNHGKQKQSKKLNRSFHFPRTSYTAQAPTPQLKKMFGKKKVNNFFSDFLSPERSKKNSRVNKSQDMGKVRESVGSPTSLSSQSRAPTPIFTIFKSMSAVESCDDNNKVTYNEETNIVTKFAFATRVGHAPSNPYKVNQDAFILAPNILNLPSMHYFGVCDGHGQNGKDVSSLIKQKLPALLEEYLYATKVDVRKSLDKSFLDCNKLLMKNKKFDVHLSGST